jgi:Glutathione S-transferase, N-terminal domain
MIELYHCIDARSFRALWVLEEMGLPYRLRVLAPSYVELNPLGTIPLMIDGDVRMTESAAIPSISRLVTGLRRSRSTQTRQTTACGSTGCTAARRH